MTNHPNRNKKASEEMMRAIWAHQRIDPQGAMRVYITGGDAQYERVLRTLISQGLATDSFIQLTRDVFPGVKLTEAGISAIGAALT